MNLVLATLVMMTQGTAHNVAALLPKAPHPVTSSYNDGCAPRCDEAQQACVRRHSGALACRHVLQPSG